jgi:hypothetical protein
MNLPPNPDWPEFLTTEELEQQTAALSTNFLEQKIDQDESPVFRGYKKLIDHVTKFPAPTKPQEIPAASTLIEQSPDQESRMFLEFAWIHYSNFVNAAYLALSRYSPSIAERSQDQFELFTSHLHGLSQSTNVSYPEKEANTYAIAAHKVETEIRQNDFETPDSLQIAINRIPKILLRGQFARENFGVAYETAMISIGSLEGFKEATEIIENQGTSSAY